MKTQFVLFVICIYLCSCSQINEQFARYIAQYGKRYANQEEYQIRLRNFEASLERSAALNAKSKKATFGITKFSDMSTQEFKDKILMKNPITERKSDVPTLNTKVKAPLPTSFDWRDKRVVTEVKDQAQCGSCWAFSATENIESMWILAGKSTNSIRLAPQQIVDCDMWDLGCGGGEPYRAYEYVIGAGGLDTEKSYPYKAVDGSCNFSVSSVGAKISTWKYATSYYDEGILQNNLVGYGPLSVCVDAENWQDYSSGVMTWEECAWINLLDHCVQLVGYQTNTTNGNYWIVRNSWGKDWGISGYIYLEMGSDTCGIAHEATCSVV